MNKKLKNIFIKLLLLFFFAGFTTLTVLSGQHMPKVSSGNLSVQLDHSQGLFFLNKKAIEEKVNEYFNGIVVIDGAQLIRLEKYLLGHPHISNANAFFDSKGVLYVSVRQRNPIARVITAENGSYYIDENGFKFPPSIHYTAKVPLITGHINESGQKVDTISTEELRQALEVLHFAQNDPFWSAQIAQVHVEPSSELSFIPRMGDHKVFLGNSAHLQEKLDRLSMFYKHVLNAKGWDAYEEINLQFKNQIVCK